MIEWHMIAGQLMMIEWHFIAGRITYDNRVPHDTGRRTGDDRVAQDSRQEN